MPHTKIVYTFWFNIFRCDLPVGEKSVTILVKFYNEPHDQIIGPDHAACHAMRRKWALDIYNQSQCRGTIDPNDDYPIFLANAGLVYKNWTKESIPNKTVISVYPDI